MSKVIHVDQDGTETVIGTPTSLPENAITFPDLSKYVSLPNVPAFTLATTNDFKLLFTAPVDCFVSVYLACTTTSNFRLHISNSFGGTDPSIIVGRGVTRATSLSAVANNTIFMRAGQVLYVSIYSASNAAFNASELSYCPLLGNVATPPQDSNADYIKNSVGVNSIGIYSSSADAKTAASNPGLIAFYTEGV